MYIIPNKKRPLINKDERTHVGFIIVRGVPLNENQRITQQQLQ